MSPFSRLLFLIYQRKVFIALYVMWRPQVICAARALSRLHCVCLCHGSKRCSGSEIVGRVSLLVLIYNIVARLHGKAGRVRFVFAEWGLVALAPMHGCASGQCGMGSQCGYKAACSKVDDYLC